MGGFQPLASPATASSTDPAAKAPGKTTASQRLPPSKIPLVEHGTVCDRDPEAEGCGRSPQQRAYLIVTLEHAVDVAMANFRDAIQDARIDLLLKKPGGAGILVDILLGLATGPAITLALRGVLRAIPAVASGLAEINEDRMAVRFAKAGAAVRDSKLLQDSIKGVLTSVTKMASDKIKGMLGADSHSAEKAAFLQAVRANLAQVSIDLVNVAPTTLDDLELEALAVGYGDQEVHSVSAYAEVIKDLLTRYDKNSIGDLGKSVRPPRDLDQDWNPSNEGPEYNFAELAWAQAGSTKRLALLSGESGKEQFEKFIDKDFVDIAIASYTARTGHDVVRTVNLDDATARAACSWADGAWLHGIFDCRP